MRFVIAAFLLAAMLGPLPARADVIGADGVNFSLEMPVGFCVLSRSNVEDQAIYEMQDGLQAGRNTVLLIAVPCGDLQAVRAGQLINHWAAWLLVGATPYRVPTGMSRQDVVADLARTMPTFDVKSVADEVAARLSNVGVSVSVNRIGLLTQDESALYTGLAMDMAAAEIQATVAGVVAMLPMAGRMVSFNVYRNFESELTYSDLLAEAKDVIARSVSATDALVQSGQ